MAAKRQFLIRREADGKMYTVVGHSPRGALRIFVETYNPPQGEFYLVKPRGEGDWDRYRV